MEYVQKRRAIVPAVYSLAKSGGRNFDETHLLTEIEYNMAVKSNFTALNTRFQVKKEKFCDEISELRQRITTYNAKGNDGLEGLDDDDIDFLQEVVDDSDSDIEFEAMMPKPGLDIVKIENVEKNSADSTSDAHAETEMNDTQTNETQSAQANEVQSVVVYECAESNEISDILSGDISFTTNDFKDRYYQDFDVSLRAAIVECLIGWNSVRPFSTFIYDKRFVGVLLKEVFSEEIGQNQLNNMHLDFIRCLFETRVNGDAARANAFDSIVGEKRCKAKDKATRNRVNSIE